MEACSRGKRKPNGNCSNAEAASSLPIQCVGDWAKDKHDYLRRYISATRGVRAKFLAPKGSGGAAFIDLFGGPGRCCVRGTRADLIDGSPLIALGQTEAPFSKVIVCDLDHENVEALRARTAQYAERAVAIEGDCNQLIDQIVNEIPPYGFNIALIDPFSAGQLHFETIRKLAMFKRMDLIINWPTGDLKRNYEHNQDEMNEILGTDDERAVVGSPEDVVAKIATLRQQLAPFGYQDDQIRSMPVKNSKHAVLYHLVFASKDPKGNQIWKSIIRRESSGQGNLF
jgi:three-Cys-motif partner protein